MQITTLAMTIDVPKGASVKGKRFVGYDGLNADAGPAGEGVPTLGVAYTDADEEESYSLLMGPTAEVETGAVAFDGTEPRVKTGPGGVAVPFTADTDVLAGVIKPGRTAQANDVIEVIILKTA